MFDEFFEFCRGKIVKITAEKFELPSGSALGFHLSEFSPAEEFD
jgi:hypothetical protein